MKDIAAAVGIPAAEDLQRTLQNLQVHQLELEVQNEELRRTQVELDAARERFSDLYDFAPIGYCTLDGKGTILEANLTAATLLGVPRSSLAGQSLDPFIVKADADDYHLHRVKQQSLQRQSVASGIEPEMLHHSGK